MCTCVYVYDSDYHVYYMFLRRVSTGSYTGRHTFNDFNFVPCSLGSTDIYVSQVQGTHIQCNSISTRNVANIATECDRSVATHI